MPETSVIGRLRERMAAWIRPAPSSFLRQPVIQFSNSLPQIIGAPASWSPHGPNLQRLIGHYADEIWVYVAVTKIAQSAASVPLRCRRGDPDDEDSDVVPSGPLPELLQRPNEFQSPFDFIEQHQTSMELAGESFILLDRGPSASGTPDAMYVLPIFNEETMKIQRGGTIRPGGPIDGYLYEVGGEKITFLPDEIIHVRYPNPFDPLRGMAPLRSAALSVSADLMAQAYNAAFFTNSAEPRGHYEAEGVVTEDQKKRFLAKIEAQLKGFRKAHRPLLMTNIKFVSTQLSPKDAEFLEQRKFSREEIIAIYGVRPVVVGLLEHNPQANAEVQWRDFWTATMMPKMTKLTNALNGELAPIFGDNLVIEWDYSKVGPLQENYSQKVGDAEKLSKMGYPLNMINKRLNLGFDDVPWGDTAFISPLLAPVEQLMPTNGNGNGNGNGATVIEEAARGKLLQSSPAIALLGASGGTVEERKRAAIAAFETRQRKSERAAKTRLLDFFHAQERRTIRNLKSEEGTRALAPMRAAAKDKRPVGVDLKVVFNEKEEAEKMQPVNRDILRRSTVESMLTFIAELGMNEDEFDFVSASVLKFLQTESFRQAKNITETTRDLLAREFTEGLGEGETIAELASRVEQVFDQRASSAETIARTETVGASNFGNHEAAIQADVQSKAWASSGDDGRTRDEHLEIDARTMENPIPLTAPFRLSDGSELMYPGDSSMGADPGQVINCRCTTLYFFGDEE